MLDTATGRPAANLAMDLFRLTGEMRDLLKSVRTNADGRIDHPLLQNDEFRAGQYELVFYAGDYLRETGCVLPEPAFLDVIPLRFGIADEAAHYHVPLLLSPYGYSTYRGS